MESNWRAWMRPRKEVESKRRRRKERERREGGEGGKEGSNCSFKYYDDFHHCLLHIYCFPLHRLLFLLLVHLIFFSSQVSLSFLLFSILHSSVLPLFTSLVPVPGLQTFLCRSYLNFLNKLSSSIVFLFSTPLTTPPLPPLLAPLVILLIGFCERKSYTYNNLNLCAAQIY